MTTDDPAARMQAVLDEHIADGRLAAPYYAETDVTAVLAELKQLRTTLPGRGFLAQAYANGWHDAIAAYRTPGWAEREASWKKYIAEVDAQPLSQQSEPTGSVS